MPEPSADDPAPARRHTASLQFGVKHSRTPLRIVSWCVAILISFYLLSYLAIGRGVLLESAARGRPYAPFYGLSSDVKARGGEDSDELVFFFGDSTLLTIDTPEHAGVVENLDSALADEYPELGDVLLVQCAFGSATLFHYYCLMFEAEKLSPDLLIIPINWFWLSPQSGFWTRRFRFHEIAGMVPISEQFRPERGNPLRMEEISLGEHLRYSLNMYVVYAEGAKAWVRNLGAEEGAPSGQMEEPIDPNKRALFWMGATPRMAEAEEYHIYAMLRSGHPSLDLVRYVATTAEMRGIRVLFYIAPIRFDRVQAARKFDRETFDLTRSLLVEAATTSTTECLDLSTLLDADRFIDNLHYKSDGHLELAGALAREVRRMLSEHPRSD